MARILFVDDDPLTLTILTKAVEIYGHQAIQARSGQEAQEIAVEQSPDMVIVDMFLTDMSGLEVIAGLRANLVTASIPVVMLSAGQELDAPGQAKAAGAEAYLQKPVQIQTLIETIRHFTSNVQNIGR